MKTVYILGAGYSKEAGLPLANEFFPAMRNVRDRLEHQAPTILVPLNETLRFVNDLHNRFDVPMPIRLDNLEDVFSLIAAESLGQNRRPGFDRFMMQNAIAYTLAIKTRDIYEEDAKITSDYARWLTIMTGGAKADDLGNTSIITLNYDDIIERSCQRNKIRYNLGFSFEEGHYKPYPDDLSLLNSMWLASSSDTNSLSLYKLHGSIRWLRQKDNKGQESLQIGDSLSILTSDELTDEPARHELVIEPPTFSKAFSDPAMRLQWRHAYNAIKNAHRIVIVGYSFPKTDQHMLYLLMSSLRYNSVGKECVIVNPEVETNAELKALCGTIYNLYKFDDIHTLAITTRQFFEDVQYQSMR